MIKDFTHPTVDDIIEDAKQFNRVAALKEMNQEALNFDKLKRKYFSAFYPDLMPKRPKVKAKTYYEKIEEL